MTEILPTELLWKVIEYLPRGDIANFRLTCRTAASAGTELLSESVRFRTSATSIDHLVAISEREDLSENVKALVWDTNLCLLHCIAYGLRGDVALLT